jgi:hypothetical protein
VTHVIRLTVISPRLFHPVSSLVILDLSHNLLDTGCETCLGSASFQVTFSKPNQFFPSCKQQIFCRFVFLVYRCDTFILVLKGSCKI